MRRSVYSLWLLPPPPVYAALSRTIRKLAVDFGGPTFRPHITLQWTTVSSKQLAVARTQQLTNAISALTVYLASVGYEDSYYKSLFLAVEPTVALSMAHNVATKVFGGGDAPYHPHLSLLYGRYSAQRKSAAIEMCRGMVGISFRVRQLQLLRTTGEVYTWSAIARYSLPID